MHSWGGFSLYVESRELVDGERVGSPKVSVCVVTYNQEMYIGECLQSLVDQEVDFEYEIIVGDDCSTDNTPRIINDYVHNYPHLVRAILHKKNIGASRNYAAVHESARGEYIAHLDGDDYALPGKLQSQSDFLDRNPECNLLWTPVLISSSGELYEQNRRFRENALGRRYRKSDLIKYGTIGTNSSKMYRKSHSGVFDVPEFGLIDYYVNVMQVGDGVACFSGTRPLGVYRLGIGVASHGYKTKEITLKTIALLAAIFPEHRLACNVAAAFRLMSDARNLRPGVKHSLKLFLETFHWGVFLQLMKELHFMKCLSVKRPDR